MHQLTNDLNNYNCKAAAVALGTFDGLHIGHQHIIDNAKGHDMPVVVYAFANIPAAYFGKDIKAILSYDEKITSFRDYGIDYLQLVPFDENIMNMSARDYLDYLYYKLSARVISCGYNYTFGRKAEGDSEFLKSYAAEKGIHAIISPPIAFNSQPVSSTRIRACLTEGNISSANEMLGKRYYISGTVQHGKRLGNKIGFPTVNIRIPSEKLCPKNGVYATCLEIDGKMYAAMTNIGVRPTVENTTVPNAETYIIGYDGDLYGKNLKIEFLSFLRPEIKFSSVNDLVIQLKKDEKTALQTYLQLI